MKRLARLLLVLAVVGLAVAILSQRPPVPRPDLHPLSGAVDRIVIEKAARRLTLIRDGKTLRSYPVALGFAPEGDKVRQGDGKTPEGIFRIDRRNAQSRFHLSLGLDYPQAEDRARARQGGYDPGGDIMIHGQPNAMPAGMKAGGDWTAGCIALTNAQIREIWEVAPIGTLVEVRP